jgi:leucyl-tRNA synthetase
LPITRYVGGPEHTTMHLLYSRFFHKALYDLGLVTTKEPYGKRMNHGLILGTDGQKMSKSKGNVEDPDEHVARVGSDTIKMYLAFVGPYNEVGQYPWDLGGIAGIRRFLERVHRLRRRVAPSIDGTIDDTIERALHQTIKKVTDDALQYKFNTAISAMMVLVNALEKEKDVPAEVYSTLLRLLAPFAPHLTEELWEDTGHTTSIHTESWPEYDESKLEGDTMQIVVQVHGKTRGTIEVARSTAEADIIAQAKTCEIVSRHLEGKEVKKEIYVKGRLVNVVV